MVNGGTNFMVKNKKKNKLRNKKKNKNKKKVLGTNGYKN